jgi:hypothetical protein
MRTIRFIFAVAVSFCLHAPISAEMTSGQADMDFKLTLTNVPPFFPPQIGPAVIGAAGDTWNSESDPSAHTSAILALTSGVASGGVTYTLSGATTIVTGGTAFGSTPYASLMGDGYVVGIGHTMTITLNGLTAFHPYDLYFYSSFANPAGTDNRSTTFTIGGISLTATTVGAPSAFVEGNNFVHFSSQPADAAGHIAVAVQGAGGNPVFDPSDMGGIVNGFQIAAVPEPSMLVLSVAALLTLAPIVRWRTKAKEPCSLNRWTKNGFGR